MIRLDLDQPFHAGELEAQARAGAGDVAQWAGGFIRDHLPEQHRTFHTSLPFLVVSGGDAEGRAWVTMVEGADGFARAPHPRLIELDTDVDPTDPLADAFRSGTEIGVLGIELANRRRNRFSGVMRARDDSYAIDIKQTFGNCPQYIHERTWARVTKTDAVEAHQSDALSDTQIALIGAADTMFIGSGHQGETGAVSNGYDASHRGGAPGFVRVVDGTHLQIPDYAGNNFFNTIGNLISDPRIGLLFVDFETGGLLHVTGVAEVDWAPLNARDPDAWRFINVEIDRVIWRPGATSLRWDRPVAQSRQLRLVRRAPETTSITSFYFAPVDDRPLPSFAPGQHLPISVQIPGQTGLTSRNYSLSGSPSDQAHYRLSVKREDHGGMSRFLHDHLRVGDIIEARDPSGTFVLPKGDGPVVLISAGVGLTPMVSMLHAAAATSRTAWYVHGARSQLDHALQTEVADLIACNETLHQRTFYSRAQDADLADREVARSGRITAKDIAAMQVGPDADYLLCGPAKFISAIMSGLEDLGVPKDRVHFETFGPSIAHS
ncbi:pyridoxamine 5'-phosphate oxidase family protein [uncultured Tateyamaria sp.]|uniref:FAD-binding oxidoreductase n=1 Tax=uncultured Tateyamaria sp. TaxID=455651 RepID=UPI00261D1863|nr:pyridoxamine 5'-phosphate oxidase family protein [uncultured Tateyamaria sp.]